MVSSISSMSASTVSLLFGTSETAPTTSNLQEHTQKLLPDATGHTDDVFKAGNAIGKIIEIVSGMNKTGSSATGVFTMDGATRVDGPNGEYSLTKTGTGTVGPDSDDISAMVDAAKGTGPEADRAKAYLEARESGSVSKADMSAMGVTSILTMTNYYNADGSSKGVEGSYNTFGMEEFFQNYIVVDEQGIPRDKATGKYAGIELNGTKYTYITY